MTDEEAWPDIHQWDLWLLDKLLLADWLGYDCGPCGVSVTSPGQYVVRPIMNLSGMGAGARIMHLEPGQHVEPGYFWCEVFDGPHITVDYGRWLEPVLAMEGIRDPGAPLWRWREWRRVEPLLFPDIPIWGEYPIVNVEFIGGKPIEIHFRPNPDARPGRVVWADEGGCDDPRFEAAPDDADGYLPVSRLGFVRDADE